MQSLSDNKRIQSVSFLKGIATILVVIGHVIQYVYDTEGFDSNIIFRTIYSFHMPLFMFISGYLSGHSTKDFYWLKKRFVRLVIPYFIWVIINFIINAIGSIRELSSLSVIYALWTAIKEPGQLWFMWILFLECLILFLGMCILRILDRRGLLQKKNTFLCEFVVLIFFYISLFVIERKITGDFGIAMIYNYLGYFWVGDMYYRYSVTDTYKPIKHKSVVAIICLPIFCICVSYWKRGDVPLFFDALYRHFPMTGGKDFLVYRIIDLYKMLTAWLGIIILWLFSDIFPKKKVCSVVSFIGLYSMETYILQFHFLNDYTGYRIIDSLLSFVLGVGLPILIAYIVEKNKLIGKILFGK